MAKAKKERYLSAGRKAAIIISGIILVIGIAFVAVYFGVLYKKVNVFQPTLVAGEKPNYAKTSAMTALMNGEYKDKLETIMSGGEVDESVLRELAIKFLTVADEAKRNVDGVEDFFIFNTADGSGEAATGGIVGEMTIRSFSLTVGDVNYTQSAGPVTSATLGALNVTKIGNNLLDQLTRSVTLNNGRDTVKATTVGAGANVPDAEMDVFPYMGVDFTGLPAYTYTYDQYIIRENNLKAPGELTSFDFTPESLKGGDDLSITYGENENGDGIWTIAFKLDCPDLNDIESSGCKDYVEYAKQVLGEEGYQKYEDVVKFARAGTRLNSASEDLEYRQYDVVLELWDNGYIRTWSTAESWAATLYVEALAAIANDGYFKGYTDSTNQVMYYYTEDEALELINENPDWADYTTCTEFIEVMAEATCDPVTGEWSFDEGGWADIASDNLAEADPDKDFGAPTYDKYPYGA